MGKYSRKVRTWGGLPEYTEHRNKSGKVTARTRYYNGKAITTRVPKEPNYTKSGYRPSRSAPSAFDGAVTGVAMFFGVLILIGAGIGWLFSVISEALVGFWPVAGGVIAWTSTALWAIAFVMAVIAALRRFFYEGPSLSAIAVTVGQGLLFAVSFFPAVALVMNPNDVTSDADIWWTNASLLGSFATIIGVVVCTIVLCFIDTAKWLFLILGMVVLFFVYAFVAMNAAFWLPAVLGAVLVLGRFNFNQALDR